MTHHSERKLSRAGVCWCKCKIRSDRSNLLRFLGPTYDSGRMRLITFLSLAATTIGCASQSNATDRQVREQDGRIKRLSANCDRLEERVVALEAALRENAGLTAKTPGANAAMPDLPTIKVVPDGQKAEAATATERYPEDATEDTRRLVIVGEGSRVETRTALENNAPLGSRQSPQVNSRAPKRNQGTFPAASTNGAQK